MVNRDPSAELTWASERHLRLCVGAPNSDETFARVRQAVAALQQARIPGLLEITPAYATILLEFALGPLDELREVDAVRRALSDAVEVPVTVRDKKAAEGGCSTFNRTVIEIPVCYEPPCATDIEDLARILGLDIPALIHLHTQPLYTVRFIGFAPGFGYLSGLPIELATPRLATPRIRVPAGSVGIAEQQTGIYPTTTSGGWRLIGRTPMVMFDAQRERPSLLAAGDCIRFVPIDLATFNAQVRGRPDHE